MESTLIPNITTIKRADGTEAHMRGNGTFQVRFAVAETFSGDREAEQIVSTAQQGSACGFPFQVGREYVVFTYVHEAQLWTSHCSRTALLEPGVENAAVTWMRGYTTAPAVSEISGSLLMPRDGGLKTVPAAIRLSGPEIRTATTDVEGKYVVRNLRAGEYAIEAQVPAGFATGPATKVTVQGKGCAEVDWPVTFEGRIRGRVVDVDGKPVADLQIDLEPARGDRTNSTRMATTDVAGSYEFEHLSPGEYVVAARHAGFLVDEGASSIYYPHSQRQDAQSIALGAAATVDQIDFVLARLRFTPSITVKVVMPDGSPAPAGLSLFAFRNGSSGHEPMRTGLTDSSGTAAMPLLYGREYFISVALDRQHVGCGSATLTFSKDKETNAVTIDHPKKCAQ